MGPTVSISTEKEGQIQKKILSAQWAKLEQQLAPLREKSRADREKQDKDLQVLREWEAQRYEQRKKGGGK